MLTVLDWRSVDDARSDEVLFSAWVDGDRGAGEVLFERYARSLHRFFSRKIAQGYDELVQTTLLRCVERKEQFRGHSSFRTYIFRVAHNVFIDHLRSRMSRVPLDLSAVSLRDLNTTPSAAVARDQETAQLLDAMSRLPVQTQLLLELAYFEKMSGPEISQVLEIPANTVRSRLSRARKALRDRLEVLAQDRS